MNSSDIHSKTDKEDRPLTRADVKRLQQEAGSSARLNLSGRNLQGIELDFFDLTGANLEGADLRKATFRKATLEGAIFSEANLEGAILSEANLRGANLTRANLTVAIFREANLEGAIFREANLEGATFEGANLYGTNFYGTHLEGANLEGADLTRAYLEGAKNRDTDPSFIEADLSLKKRRVAIEKETFTLSIRITEEPLTAKNFSTIISTLTELYTKALLIQQGRFSDLVNYAQTHDIRFAKEANLTIGKLSHDSPALIELLLNPTTLAAAAGAVVTLAGALKIAIDNVGQTQLRYKATELENQKKELEIKIREQEAQQKSDLEKQQTQLELEKQRLEMEKQQLEIERQRLEVEKNRVEIALETAGKMVDALRPGIDVETKGMLMQTLLPNLLQLGHAQGLELALPASQENEDKNEEENK
jgi:Pentapeptide repeats (8 copies)